MRRGNRRGQQGTRGRREVLASRESGRGQGGEKGWKWGRREAVKEKEERREQKEEEQEQREETEQDIRRRSGKNEKKGAMKEERNRRNKVRSKISK